MGVEDITVISHHIVTSRHECYARNCGLSFLSSSNDNTDSIKKNSIVMIINHHDIHNTYNFNSRGNLERAIPETQNTGFWSRNLI